MHLAVLADLFGKTVRCRGCSGLVTVGGATTTLADGPPLGYTIEAEPAPRPAARPAPKAEKPPAVTPVTPADWGTGSEKPRAGPSPKAERLGRFVQPLAQGGRGV